VFVSLVHLKFGSPFEPPTPIKDDNVLDKYKDDDEAARVIPEFSDPVNAVGRAIDQQPAYNKILNTTLMFPNGDL
jgi:hypothetical protein